MDIPVRQSSRARRMSLVVHQNGFAEVVVPSKRAPSHRSIARFIKANLDWLRHHIERTKTAREKTSLSHHGVGREIIASRTRELVADTLELLNESRACRINIRNYRSQWGSCSSSLSLGFHYKLSLLPQSLSRYIIIHEVSHIDNFNHSADFWRAVERLCPDYKQCRKQLRRFVL